MAVQLTGVDMEAKLALTEFLLATSDLQVSARRGVDWLAAHAGVEQALVVVADPASPSLLLVAEHGISSSALVDFSLSREDEGHPLVRAMDRPEPTYFDGSGSVRGPIEETPFFGIPLRGEEDTASTGLLLVSVHGPDLQPDVAWVGRMLGPASDRNGCCSTASSTPSPIRSCSPTRKES
jgi:hypothetical protein